MIQLDNGKVIIGVDVGYQMVKTKNFVFENGCKAMQVEPSVTNHTMKIDEKYYKVGEGRSGLAESMTGSYESKLLTYAGIAKELQQEGIYEAEVILAVGLPFANYGAEKNKLIAHLQKPEDIRYAYEGKHYHIQICKVRAFPQCYAAIATRLANMQGEYLIVDIGSKTVDLVWVKNGIPNESKSTSLEKAIVKWMRHIQAELQSAYGKLVPENEIMKVMLGESNHLLLEIRNTIRELLKDFIDNLESTMTQILEEMVVLGETGR